FANYVNSHYAVLLPKSSYRISGELNKKADSIGTAIVPVHFSFASNGEWGVGSGECGLRIEEILQLRSPHFAILDCRSRFKKSAIRNPQSAIPAPHIEQSGNNIQQDRARIFGGVRLTFLLY